MFDWLRISFACVLWGEECTHVLPFRGGVMGNVSPSHLSLKQAQAVQYLCVQNDHTPFSSNQLEYTSSTSSWDEHRVLSDAKSRHLGGRSYCAFCTPRTPCLYGGMNLRTYCPCRPPSISRTHLPTDRFVVMTGHAPFADLAHLEKRASAERSAVHTPHILGIR
jgi:hypothetical protein